MPNFNHAVLMGNLTRDPELTYTSNGTAVCHFTVAVNRKIKDKERTLFMKCVAFGTRADVLAKYISKGRALLVSGELVEQRWEDQDKNKHSRIELEVNDFQFLGDGKKVQVEESPAF